MIVGEVLRTTDQCDASIAAKCLARIAGDAQVRVKAGRLIVVIGGIDGPGGADADTAFGPDALRCEGDMPEELIGDVAPVFAGQSIHCGQQHPPVCRNLLVAVSLGFAIGLKTRHHGRGGLCRPFAQKCEQLATG